MNLTQKIENVLRRIVIPKYPFITEFEVKDLFVDDAWKPSMLGKYYVVDITTSECLDSNKQMEIDTEIKSLFLMLSPTNPNPFSLETPTISCFFDCGDGEGFNFHSSYGYKH